MPTRKFLWFDRGPVGAGEEGWGKASSLSYWKRLSNSRAEPGDIVAAHSNNVYHVGIIVGHHETVHMSSRADEVVKNSWPYGYSSYTGVVYWRYEG
jgi:cell wall-associated NlpC family hydrolase